MAKEMQMIVAAAVIFVLITGGLAYWTMDLSDEVAIKDGEIAAVQKKIDAADKEIKKKPALEAEKEALDKHIARYVTILPPPEVASKQSFLRMVQEKCERSQLNAKSIVFVEPKKKRSRGKSKKPAVAPGFNEVKVDIEAVSTYDEFLRFLNSVERHETFLRVNSFSCRVIPFDEDEGPTEGDDGEIVWKLEIRLQVSTFTYSGKSTKKKKKK
jgi:hypothetical protein